MTRKQSDDTGLLNRFINVPEKLHDTMTATNRGISMGTGTAIAVVLLIVIAVVFLGAAALGGNGGPPIIGNQTTTQPPMSTQEPATTSTASTQTSTPGRNLDHFKQRFATRLETAHDAFEVIDVAVRNNTIYVTTHGPAQSGPAVATADDLAQAFTDQMKSQWEDEASDIGIDHAVVQLYNETSYHWFTYRIEESWAYRYHTGDIDLSKITNMIADASHDSNTDDFLNQAKFQQNVSSIDGVKVRSLEQYGSTYFLALKMDDYAGSDYNQTIFKISEALFHDRNIEERIVTLHYVVYGENSTVVTSNRWSTGWAAAWREGEITKAGYRTSLTWNKYDAKQIPGDIGSMLTRIQPFPAEGPDE